MSLIFISSPTIGRCKIRICFDYALFFVFRKKGRSYRHRRAVERVHYYRGDWRYSLLLAADIHGPLRWKLVFGAVDTWIFYDWIFEELMDSVNRYPQARSVIILDNIKFHSNRMIRLFASRTGCLILSLPRYSPYLNMAEYVFNAVKARCRNIGSFGYFESMISILSSVSLLRGRDWAGLLRELEYI